MLQVSELRIGSWILEDGQPVKVFAIEYGGEPYCRINETVASKKDISDIFKPIVLTPEFLQKIGFVAKDEREELSFLITSNDYLAYSQENKSFHLNGGSLPKSPAFVHQFQNMYLILKGEELDFQFQQI